MNSSDESFIISPKETLLQNQPSPSSKSITRKKILKIVFILLILTILVGGCLILSSTWKVRKPDPFDSRLSDFRQNYCHLTRYSSLCYESMSSLINTTDLITNPTTIFTASIRIAINELKNSTTSIDKSLSTPLNNSVSESRLRDCKIWVNDSVIKLNESLSTLEVDSSPWLLTYEEIDSVKSWALAARTGALKCFRALEAIDEDKMGVEEVKSGVERAGKYIINSIGLMDKSEWILNDSYNPYIESEEYYYSSDYYNFNLIGLVCMFSAMYLFIGFLYIMFWRSR